MLPLYTRQEARHYGRSSILGLQGGGLCLEIEELIKNLGLRIHTLETKLAVAKEQIRLLKRELEKYINGT